MTIDPVTLAVLGHRCAQIADEMDATLFRSAFNPIIAEAHDASHGLYDAATGDTLVQGASGLPVFAGSMAGAVKLVIDTVAGRDDEFADGDVFVFNDPYAGGTHLNDMKLVRPYFRGGELWCHLASVAHYTDVGGNVPGNYNPAATESAQEGVLIPPVRLRAAGELRTDIVDVICGISRTPTAAYGDLHAQLNALDLGVRRLDELLDSYGDDVVAEALSELSDRAERLIAAQLSELPDGTVSIDDWLDNDGATAELIPVALDMTVDGDRLTLDFSRTAPAAIGPVNISRSTAEAACYVALKHLFDDVPANRGCLRPVDIIIPERSLLAAEYPRPVAGYTETILRVMDCIFRAFATIDPERALGCSYGTINALSLAGHRPNGDRWVMFTFYGGGLGASADSDGLNHGNAPLSTATIPPVEILESQYPVRYTRWELRPDSGGRGTHRGGLGATYEIELLDEDAEAFVFGDRAAAAPQGVVGGGEAARNQVSFTIDGETTSPALGAKATGLHLRRGDRVRLDTPGGGGYGDPDARDADAAAFDRSLGYVTDEGTPSGTGAGGVTAASSEPGAAS